MQDPVGTFSLQPVHAVVFGLFTLTMINYNFSLQSVANLFFFLMFCTALTELLPGILNQLVRILKQILFFYFFFSSCTCSGSILSLV